MHAAFACMEVLEACAIETGKAFHLIVHGVGMDQVHDNGQPQAMGGIHQLL